MAETPPDDYFPDERHRGQTVLQKAQRVLLRILRIVDRISSENGLSYWLDGGTLLGAIRHGGFIPWDDDVDIVMPRGDYEQFLRIAPAMLPDDVQILMPRRSPSHACFAVPCKLSDRYSLVTESYPGNMGGQDSGLSVDIIPADAFRAHGVGHAIDRTIKWTYRSLSKINDAQDSANRGLYYVASELLRLCEPALSPATPIRSFHDFVHKRVIPNRPAAADAALVGYGFDSHWTRLFDPDDIFPLQRLPFEGRNLLAPRNPDCILKVFYKDYKSLPPEEKRKPAHIKSLIVDTRRSGVSERMDASQPLPTATARPTDGQSTSKTNVQTLE